MQKTLIALTLIAAQASAAPLFSDDIAAGKQPLTYLGKDSKAATARLRTSLLRRPHQNLPTAALAQYSTNFVLYVSRSS